MTDDFEPVSEMPPVDPAPQYEERDTIIEQGEQETGYHPHGDVTPPPTADAVGGWQKKPAAKPILERLRGFFWGSAENTAERIRHLDAAIEQSADTPSNYVLRGELYLNLREYALARRDFQRAYELATEQFQRSDWGVIAQAMQDRALDGLRKADKKLPADTVLP